MNTTSTTAEHAFLVEPFIDEARHAAHVEIRPSGTTAADHAVRLMRTLRANPRALDRIYAAARDHYQWDAAVAALAAMLHDLTTELTPEAADDLGHHISTEAGHAMTTAFLTSQASA